MVSVVNIDKHVDFGGNYRTRFQSSIQYAASFPPGVPATYINMFTKPGDTVLDPFSGKGTTPLQALLMGRNAIGNDLSPVAYHYVHSRVHTPKKADIIDAIRRLDEECRGETVNIYDWESLLFIYHPDTLLRILQARQLLLERTDKMSMFLKALIMSSLYGSGDRVLSGNLPGSFPINLGSMAKMRLKKETKPPYKDLRATLTGKVEYIFVSGVPDMEGTVYNMNSAKLDEVVAPGSVRLVCTSPPYINLMAYGEKTWLQQWFLDRNYKEYDEKTREIGSCSGNYDAYFGFMKDVLKAMYIVMAEDSVGVYVIGGSRSRKKDEGELYIPMRLAEIGNSLGYEAKYVFSREFHSTFRSMFSDETRKEAGTDYRDASVVFYKGNPETYMDIEEAHRELAKEEAIEENLALELGEDD